MSPSLLRRFFGSVLLLMLAMLGTRPAQASHLLGGEMNYRYLDANGPAGNQFRYEITVTLYINALPGTPGTPTTSQTVFVYNRTTGVRQTVTLPGTISPIISGPSIPPGCNITPPNQPFFVNRFVGTVNLPLSFDGYYAVFTLSARNAGIANLANSDSFPLTLYVSMSPPLIPNRSPVFSDTAVAIICQNDTTISLNNAVDPDGDRLVYSFGAPYGDSPNNFAAVPPLPTPIPYASASYSVATPFGTGTGNFALINANTGIAKYGSRANQGTKFVVAVDVSEYRSINGREVLVGSTRRDLQLLVSTCPATPPPALPPSVTTPRNYTIEEGQSLSIPITATQATSSHPLVMTVNSALLDGSGPFNTTFNGSTGTVVAGNVTGTANATGNGTVSGTFVFNSACGNGRTAPYDLAVTVKDNGCGGKIASDIFRVTVNRAAGPNAITGPATVCDPATVRTYTAAGPVPASYNWRISGGTINSGQGTNTVNVTWASANSTGTLVLKGVSTYGCLSDSVVKTVDIRPLAALAVTPTSASICRGTSTTLSVTGPAGLTYTWTGGSQPVTGSTIIVTPTATTTYTVTGTDGTCSITSTTTVTVTPPPTANAGPDLNVCAGATSATLGTAPVAGVTYSWGPATGLSSTTVAQPTVTLPNAGTTPIVRNYGLTASIGANCLSVDSVRVTINPSAVANAGPAITACSGVASAPLGTAALPGYTYSWSPATGLSSTTAAQPTVTLPNTTGAPITQTYTLTATNAQGCPATATVVVTITPVAVAAVGPAISFCSGTTSTPLGGTATPVAGTTYAWTPTTGLSNPNILNPTVTGTNATGAPITTTYTLTATTANGCTATGTVAVTINPAAVAQAGPARSTCSNVGVSIGTGTTVAGTTYAWLPTTGLSNTTASNPTMTLPNSGSTNITQTYTVTATTANGCTATSTVTVTVFPAAVATPGPAISFCSGTTSAPLGGTATPVAGTTYAWTPTTGLSNPNILNPTVTGTNATGAPITTTYTLTATTANGCTATGTVAVTINPAAVAQAGPARSTCSNVGVVIGTGTPVTGTTYAWTPTTGLSSTTSLTPTLTLPNLTGTPIVATYTLTATTASGCTATSTVAVTVNPAAVAQAGLDKTTCSNVGVTIGTGTAITGTTYAWTPATGLSSASALTPTVTLPNTTGAAITQQYILLATTANGCFQRDTVVVTINPAAVAVAGANRPVCSGLATTLGAAAVTGYTYSWSPSTGLSNTSVANPTFTLTNTTTTPNPIVFTLTATTANGCVATSTVTVTVNPAAVANAGPAVSVCDGKRVTLGTAALAGYTYSWSPTTNLNNATSAQPVLTGVNPGTTPLTATYTLTATTASGCVSTSTVIVTINPRPAAEAITGPASVCPTVTGIAYSVVNPAATAYTWLINGGTIASGQGTPAITVNWGVASTGGYIKVFRLNAQGCSSDTTTLPIIINQRLQTVRPTGPGDIVAASPLPRSVCQADGPYTYISGVFANGSSYSWQIIGGTQVSTLQNSVTVNWNPVTVPTLGKIVVTETSNPSGGICRGVSDTLKVLINPSPRTNLAITAPVRVCQNSGPVTFSLPGGFTGSTYVFQLAGNTIAGTGNTRTLSNLPAAGTYTLTAQETTVAGCVGPLYTTQFTVSPTPGAPTISGSGFVCNVATPQQYSIANATAGSSYQWTVVGGTVTAGNGTNQVTVQFGATGPYTVSAAETSGTPASCVGTTTTRTIILDNPTVALTTASVDMTSNARVILTLRAPASSNTPNQIQIMRRVAGSGTYASVGTVAASATTFTDNNAVDASGNSYEYRLDLTNGCGTLLSSLVSRTIRLVAVATPGAGGRDQGSTALTWNAYQGFTVDKYEIYRRSDAGTPELVTTVPAGTLQATVSNTDPTSTATSVGFDQNFRVVAVSTDATPLRSNSNEANVKFANQTNTYNIITPNRDGLNDVLVIDNIQLYPGNTFTVFNRWGREVYKTTNYQNNWGQDDNIAPGNYFYILTRPNGPTVKNWFEVVK
ncbi:gliding motility-associated C-terminal domain-containing protein [Hymenobacter negativus]|uniref:Gliding motility-associated C-terminal domain-containing protein n=1 Tax=Hymenobacter negativus TaxID=2795026 RepID=A0ABS3QD15_9BACT|nr:gliding motility-associated C-terminal domain-containing protein [Hymenobacter negativus]MBO2009021.1 gliding motility-associated C-terminal domain-containing protein [Hymenobacter negativus]